MKKKKVFFVWFIPVFLLFSALALVFWDRERTEESRAKEEALQEKAKNQVLSELVLEADEHLLGNSETAEVVVIEYSDTECPWCKSFHYKFLEQVFKVQNGRVAWVYRHFPLSIYPNSQKEAEALECATEQKGNDVFWNYLEKLFAVTPSNNGLDPAELPKIARELKLDVPAFQSCLAEGRFAGEVNNQRAEGARVGVHQTPSVIIWDKKSEERTLVSGANSRFLEVKALVEKYLK